MTENKPLALHLADCLDYNEFDVVEDSQRTAAELRRLYQENEEDQGVIAVWRGRTQRAEAQRDQLLEVLKLALSSHGVMLMSDPPQDAWKFHGVEAKAWAVIKAVEERK